jgi:hypothetical protein
MTQLASMRQEELNDSRQVSGNVSTLIANEMPNVVL